MSIYLDYAATTPMDNRVMAKIEPFLAQNFGNASSIHSAGQKARQAVDEARAQITRFLSAQVSEIYFVSGATEANNWAIKGVLEKSIVKNPKIITSAIEHHCVLESVKYLEKTNKCEVAYIKPKENGIVDPQEVADNVDEQTILVSIMLANNEVGTIQPITEISKLVKKRNSNILIHTDAVQAINYLNCDVNKLGVDLLSLSGHKIYGPKGIGALYIKNGVKIAKFMHGGAQEDQKRAGTLNVPGIVGLGEAIELVKTQQEKNKEIKKMRDYLIEQILTKISGAQLNGDRNQRLPNNAHFSFNKAEGESLMLALDMEGIYVSTGSACASGSLEASHVLLAMGLPHTLAHGSIRFSLGKDTTPADIDYVLSKLPPIVAKMQKIAAGIKING